ncbi:LacI family DNA-binding transcriptional regulator [Lachnoclostridium sp. Marseille-P6806]|uniref:LacI family DNA-binding transcriptional regulator n=1 Tax=Lachnoclostridium sp. Marseille-P6806 TaxID=2364793 RepID=UPI00102FE6B9|nr:LacI family DNA-binding transcriptional regulator [Lachnoclostridium sp. Marseille-P6806]
MTSIRDVAREAGVAISTVSKVVNRYPNVSEETRSRVEAAIQKLHFVPNAAASALSSKQAARVALIISPGEGGVMDEINMQYLSGAFRSARELGLDVITVFAPMAEKQSVPEMIQYFRTQSIAGLVIFNLNREQTTLRGLIQSEEFRAAVVDAPIVNAHSSCVSVDNEQAQYDVADRLCGEGVMRRILYIAGSADGYITEERLAGMRRLARERNLVLTEKEGGFSQKRAREITGEYAADHDAVVCASDIMAIGAMRRLMEMDIFRPVCGFDGLSLMGYAGKQMYTVRQDFDGIACAAVAEVHRLMNGGEGRQIVMPHEIVRMTYEDVIR